MTGSNLTLDQESLQHRLMDVPPGVRPHIRMGFHLLSRIEPERRSALTQYIIQTLIESREIESSHAQKVSGLNDHTIGDTLTAITFAIASIIDLDVSKDDFLSFVPDEILDPVDRPAAEQVLASVPSRREELKSAMDTSSLARTVLPSYRRISIQTDMRVKFADDGSIAGTAPVAICFLTTDIEAEELFFQAELDDIERLIKSLGVVKENLRRLKGLKLTDG